MEYLQIISCPELPFKDTDKPFVVDGWKGPNQFSLDMSADKPLAVVLVDEGYEDLEVHYPRLRLEEAGFHVEVVGEKAGHNYNSKHDYWAKTTKVFKDIDASKVKVLVIPGGWAPDRLRRSKECLDLVVACNEHKAIIGAFRCLFFASNSCYFEY